MTTLQPSWREERRQDRLTAARITRENETAQAQNHVAERQALARLRREEKQGRRDARQRARKATAVRRKERTAWLRAHTVDLLFVPVIAVPGVLAWTAMAAYGYQVFGPAGWALPAFSEGAMWAFAAATTITRHRHPERPVWHLRLGTAVFATVGASLNFIHGVTPAPGQTRGIGAGVVMALVSVAGVVAHQFVTAGPRRSRAERDAARIERAIARRERIIQRAAVRRMVAELDADGNARLVNRPGMVALTRRWYGRVRLAAVPQAQPWPRPAPVFDAPAEPPAPAPQRATASDGLRPAPRVIESVSGAPSKTPERTKVARQKPPSDRASKRAKAEKLLRANPAMSRADVVRLSGVSERTADRIRAELPRQLHVAEG